MHPLDIISGSPNLYIFGKESNKTNFGGVLFLIYLIVIAFICIYYIIDYTKNEKYIIQFFDHFNFKSRKEIEERKENILFNPNISLKLDISFDLGSEYEKLKLYEPKTGSFIDINTFFSRKIDGLFIDLLYECHNKTCYDYYDSIKDYKYNYYLNLRYEGFLLDHQSNNEPIIRQNDEGNIIFKNHYGFNVNTTTTVIFNWKNIIYTEKKGFLQNDAKYGCEYLETYEQIPFGYLKIIQLFNKTYINLISMEFANNNEHYTEYFRKRISELDLLANILSLIVNFFTGVKFIFSFYSKNFNNFKIIEKILNRQTNIKKEINISSELKDLNNNNFISINDDLNENCINQIKDDENNDEDENNENNYDDNLINNETDMNNKRIKKLKFIDFFLNNFYCCFKNKKQQKIIHICNEIISKYSSIDSIVRNQILIEKLLKDYKLKNDNLNNLENNNLFFQLKNYL